MQTRSSIIGRARTLLLLSLISTVGAFSVSAAVSTSAAASDMNAVRRCIVTGGSSGIGASICVALGRKGHLVFVTGRNKEAAEHVAAEVTKVGGRGAAGVGDVCSSADVARLAGEAAKFFGEGSPCDVLVTSAGIGRFGTVEEISEADFDATFQVNVKGSWLWARELVPVFKAQGHGQLLFVSSVAGLRTFARCSAYGASKWAVQGIAGSIREECKGSGVKVATLCPGSVATPWWLEQARGGKPEPASAEQLAKMLSPDDVAAAALAIVEQGKTSDIQTLSLDPAA